MRRLLSFLSMVITILVIVFLGMPTLLETPNLGIEFKGGYEIVYEITDDDGNHSLELAQAAAEIIAERVDIAGVKNPNVEIEGDESQYVRVSVASGSESELVAVQTLIESDVNITFTDSTGKILMYGNEVLAEENGAVLGYDQGKPVIMLNIKDTTKFGEVTSSLVGQNMLAWIGYREESEDYVGDFNAAFNQKGSEAEQLAAQKKIIINATVNEAINSSTAQIQGSFSSKEAASIAKLLEAGSTDFNIERGDVLRVSGAYGATSFNRSVIAGLVGILIIMLLMVMVYKISGLVVCVTLLFYTVMTLLTFNLLGGEYGPDTIAAIVIGIGMAVDSCVILFERIRDELYKGRSVKSAYNEGTKKSLSSIIDANVTTLIASLVLYFFGKRAVKGFATMLLISVIYSVLIMLLITRLLMWLLIKSNNLDNKKYLFAVDEKKIPDVTKGEEQTYFGPVGKVSFMKQCKKVFCGSGLVVVGGLIAMLVFGLTKGNVMNFGLEFSEGSSISVQLIDTSKFELEELKDKNGNINEVSVRYFLEETLFPGEAKPNFVSVSTYTAKDSSNADVECIDIKAEYKEHFASLSTFADEFKLKLEITDMEIIEDNLVITQQTSTPVMAKMTVKNALLSLGLAFVLIIIYIAIRFRFTYAIAAIIALAHDVIITCALFAIFRIELNVEFVSAILAIVGYSINNTIVIFDRVREISNETNHGLVGKSDRMGIVDKALQNTFSRSVLTTLTTLIPVLALIFIGTNATLNFSLAILFGLLAGMLSSMFLAPRIWISLENIFKYKQKEKKAAKANKKKVVSNEPEELIIVGINDF